MPNSHGIRSRTRYLFSVPPKTHGTEHMSSYLTVFHRGDYVDIKVNGRIHKGMPYKYYHGRTGVVWNVNPRSIGVEVNKRVGNHIVKKRFHVRPEHLVKSACRQDFYNRVKANLANRLRSKKEHIYVPLKRVPKGPSPAVILDKSLLDIQDVSPVPHIKIY